MASPSKKPRDIKNLKARLGRTITPGQAGLPSTPPIGGSVPPPTIGGPAPMPAAGSIPPPSASYPLGGVPAARPNPLGGNPLGGNPLGGSVPPPTAVSPLGGPAPGAVAPRAHAPQQAAQQPLSAQAAPAARAANPFGAAAIPVQAEKKVTLVIDDSAIDQGEIGRKSAFKSTILIVVGVVLGLAVGWMVGGTRMEREQFNMALRDGKDIHEKIKETSKVLDVVKKNVKAAVSASQSGPSNSAKVDYDAVQALVSLERPFTANEFHRRRYRAFPPNVVDDLFDYYNNINQMWDQFIVLGARTAGNKREALDESAKAADGLVKTQYGAVLTKAGDAFAAGLVYVDIPEQTEERKEGEAPVVNVASSQGGRTVERKVYMGADDLAENYNNYVFMVDKLRSREILGESANLFAKYQGMLMDVNGLLDRTMETQGRLLKELGKVASLEEQSVF